jgi:hypothetical protein
VTILQKLFKWTLNNVWFGILMMLLTALYVAIGSGFPAVREFFEMDELKFFNAWPLKALMWLLVLSLTTVTFLRIPFTKPRFGVWMVHTGIVTLIFGMAFYYRNKVEGLAIVLKGQAADYFYDKDERSLHMRVGGMPLVMHPMPSLPRFKAHEDPAQLRGEDLHDITPYREFTSKDGKLVTHTLSEELGLKDPVRLDVVAYYPWATIRTNFAEDANEGTPGVKLILKDPHTGTDASEWLVAGDAQTASSTLGDVEFEHRIGGAAEIKAAREGVTRIHRIDVKVPGFENSLFVEPGKTYPLGSTGYSLEISEFQPNFPAMNGEMVRLLTMMVHTPTQTFRRQLIPDRAKPTDWKLNVAGAGPMGKRQTEPLDAQLETHYAFSDPMRLLSRDGAEKKIIYTSDESPMVVITTSPRAASTVEAFADNKGELTIGPPGHAMKLTMEAVPHVRHDDIAEIVPPAKRDPKVGEVGFFQVVVVKVTCGNWTKTVPVPFSQWAAEPVVAWNNGSVMIPGAAAPLQMQLGQTRLPLPARVTLEKFELVMYPGAVGTNGIPRDFRASIAIDDEKHPVVHDIAYMNHPVYWGGLGDSYWTFFQAQWDPDGQRYTVLGVGNRPGTWIMTAGCVLIVIGLLYAFYLKPIIIERMKQAAIENARTKSVEQRERVAV